MVIVITGVMAAGKSAVAQLGLWLDNSDLTVDHTVERILAYVT